MSGRSSPDVKVALRCGYGNPRRKGSLLALCFTSACKTGRNLPLSVIDEECLDLTTPDVPTDQRNANGLSPATDVPPAANEPIRGGSSPQGSTAATSFALKRDTHVPEGTRSGGTDEETPPAPPTVLTTLFFVDLPETPSAQAEDDSRILSRRTGREPPAASRNTLNNSGAVATTVPGESVPISGPEIEAPVGQVTCRVSQTKSCPSSYLGGEKPPPLQAHASRRV